MSYILEKGVVHDSTFRDQRRERAAIQGYQCTLPRRRRGEKGKNWKKHFKPKFH